MPTKPAQAIAAATKLLKKLRATDDQPIDDNAASTDIAPSAGRFIDLATFFAAFDAYSDATAGEGSALQSGLTLASKNLSEFNAGVEQFLVPLFDQFGFKQFARRWTMLKRPTKAKSRQEERGTFVVEVMEKLRSKPSLFRSIFSDGRVYQSAMKLANVADAATPNERMGALALIRSAGSMTQTRRWVKEAATDLGIEVPEFEDVISDVVEAQAIGDQLRVTEVKLSQTSHDDLAAREDLENQRTGLMEQVQMVAEGSANPQAVISSAANAAAKSKFGYATEAGRIADLNAQQEDAMMVRGKAVIAAGAGSGKTRVLAAKVIYHMNELGVSAEQIIATSFSRKSAHELKERIVKFGGRGMEGVGDDGFGTTHSIAGKLISRFRPDMKRGKSIADKKGSLSQSTLVKMAMAQVEMRAMRPVTSAPNPNESFFDAQALVQNVPPSQVTQTMGPEGPTPTRLEPEATEAASFSEALRRALDFHKDNPSVPYADLAISLISDILRRRIPKERLSDKQRYALRMAFKRAGVRFSASVVEAAILKAAERKPDGIYWKEPANQWFNLGISFVDAHGRPLGHKAVAREITKWKGSLVTPGKAFTDAQQLVRSGVARPETLAIPAAYAAYEWLKQNDPKYGGGADFDDLLINVSRMMIADPRVLSAVRSRFKVILVDEAQDLNPAQHLMFGLIAGFIDPATQKPYGDGRMTADTYAFIGDDKQSIYEFRGATPDEFINLSDLVPGGAGFTTKLLDVNYRSGKLIVDAANRIIAHNTKQIPMTCSANEARQGAGAIRGIGAPTAPEVAALVAAQIEESTSGETPVNTFSDFGIVLRTNAEAFSFVTELLKRGIPFRSKINPFNNHTVKAILQWMKLANAGSNMTVINEAVLNAFRAPRFNLDQNFEKAVESLAKQNKGKDYIQVLESNWSRVYSSDQNWRNKKYVQPYLQALKTVRDLKGTPSEVLDFILTMKGPEIGGKEESIIEALMDEIREDPDEMDKLAQELGGQDKVTDDDIRKLAIAPIEPLMGLVSAYTEMSLAMGYIEKLERANDKLAKSDDPDDASFKDGAVVIDTVHGWKGLEAKHIYVPMAHGTFPHIKAASEAELASERRLAYVAITRGQDSVTIVWPERGSAGGQRDVPIGPSQFYYEACVPTETEQAESQLTQDVLNPTVPETLEAIESSVLSASADMEDLLDSKWASAIEDYYSTGPQFTLRAAPLEGEDAPPAPGELSDGAQDVEDEALSDEDGAEEEVTEEVAASVRRAKKLQALLRTVG